MSKHNRERRVRRIRQQLDNGKGIEKDETLRLLSNGRITGRKQARSFMELRYDMVEEILTGQPKPEGDHV